MGDRRAYELIRFLLIPCIVPSGRPGPAGVAPNLLKLSRKIMHKFRFASILAGLLLTSSANAVIISNATPIPDANVLINFNSSGLDWVYAGPIGPDEWGPGNIEPASYRAAEGWRTATASEWAAHPLWSDFIAPGNPGGIVSPLNGYTNHANYLFASEYWSDFSHVDMGDFAAGIVTDGVNNPSVIGDVPETIYVRNSRSAVPEPLSLAMVAIGLAGLGATRRRKVG